MQSEWLINEIYKIQKNRTCEILKKPLEFDTEFTYEALLEEVEKALKNLKQPGGCYKPPLTNESRKKHIQELKPLREYLKQKIK